MDTPRPLQKQSRNPPLHVYLRVAGARRNSPRRTEYCRDANKMCNVRPSAAVLLKKLRRHKVSRRNAVVKFEIPVDLANRLTIRTGIQKNFLQSGSTNVEVYRRDPFSKHRYSFSITYVGGFWKCR